MTGGLHTVAIDATGTARHTTGIGYYSVAAARAVMLVSGGVSVSVLRQCSLARPASLLEHPDLRSRWALWPREALHRLPALAERVRYHPDKAVDVFHATETVLRSVRATAVIATVHDLGALRGVVQAAAEDVARARAAFEPALDRANSILTVSAASARDLAAVFPQYAGKVRVVYPGVIPVVPVAVPRCPRTYVAFVGATNRRKHLDVLVQAVSHLYERGEWPSGLRVVLAGPPGDFEGALLALARAMGVASLVERIGYLNSDGAVEWVIRHAVCCVYPGPHEGFGFPAVRAMAGGVPVVASAGGAMPEVTAGAARLFPPGDHVRLAEAVGEVLHDQQIRERLIRDGLIRAQAFSLRAFGSGLMTAYAQALESAGG